MDIRQLQRAIVKGLEDVKAQNIVVLDTEHLSPFFERVIVASGTSNRQTKALAASVRDTVKTDGWPIPRMEGQENGEWIIVDCGPAVVHVMQPLIRDYYRLEELWGDKPMALHDASEGKSAKPLAKKTARVASKTSVAAQKTTVRSRSKAIAVAEESISAPPQTTARKKAASSPTAASAPAKPARKTRTASAASAGASNDTPPPRPAVRKRAAPSASSLEKPSTAPRAARKKTTT
jgi:ribosome-associated protein